MTATRSDFLSVCNDQGVPLDDFKRAFCDRCMQPECTRSQVGGSKFEQRIQDWNRKLFLEPPLLDAHDPRHASITSKRFLMIDTGPIPEIRTSSGGSWVDPRDLSDANPGATPRSISAPLAPPPAPPQQDQAAPTQATVARVATTNTPLRAPQMLPGAPVASPKADWVGSETSSASGDKVMQPGSKIRLGGRGSGV